MTTSNPEADKVLFIPAGDDFAIVSHVEGDQPFGRDASNLPLITWPNGGWCFDANAFMLRLVDRGLSRFVCVRQSHVEVTGRVSQDRVHAKERAHDAKRIRDFET